MTTEITLTDTPQKITDGTEQAFISCCSGNFRFADSDTEPDINASHPATQLTVNPPFVIWIWAGSVNTVSVSKRKSQ